MTRRSIAAALALLVVAVSGCAATPCDDLADAAAERGCSSRQADQAEIECEGEAEVYARCWVENVRDVCRPTTAELLDVSDCQAR